MTLARGHDFSKLDILQIALGHNSSVTAELKFGSNDTVGNTTETVWSEGGLYAFPASASVMKVSSASATDTGAASVKIIGLDSSYNELEETVTLTGQSSVNTTGSFLRVHRMQMITPAVGQTENVGIVYAGTGTITTGKPANVFCLISATKNQSLVAYFTIKTGFKGLVTSIHYGAATKTVTLEFQVRETGSTLFRVMWRMVFKDQSGSMIFTVPLVIPEKADWKMQAVSDTASADVGIAVGLILIKD